MISIPGSKEDFKRDIFHYMTDMAAPYRTVTPVPGVMK